MQINNFNLCLLQVVNKTRCKQNGVLFKMLSINEIKKPIAADIDVFEGKFKASMQSSVPLLDRITHYIV
ncbi:MAG: octaprenyl-diphosphate synthase, partial [Mucilaginibacter sp.]|nr:octaprenyl-diphosphate synthase [Mucilaginibacter sp.]